MLPSSLSDETTSAVAELGLLVSWETVRGNIVEKSSTPPSLLVDTTFRRVAKTIRLPSPLIVAFMGTSVVRAPKQ
jgi:hypothetical protein